MILTVTYNKYKSSGKQNPKEADIANMKPLHWNEHATITFRNFDEINYSAMYLKSLLKVQQNSLMKHGNFKCCINDILCLVVTSFQLAYLILRFLK